MDPHILAKQKQDDQLGHTYSSYVRIRDVAQKTCQKRWMIGISGERGSGISVLAARHDDDDDLYRSRRYPEKTITDMDYADDIALLANAPAQAETLLHSLERAGAGISLHINAHKMKYMGFIQTGDIFTLNGTSLKQNWQVQLLRKQCLINWDRHQYATSKGMDS